MTPVVALPFLLLLTTPCLGVRPLMGDPGSLSDSGLDLSESQQERGISHRRTKRFLSFPPSSTAQLSSKLTVPLFDEYNSYVKGSYKGFLIVKYALPTDIVTIGRALSDSFLQPSGSIARDRIEAYTAIENVFESAGMPGKHCLLKAICEASQEGLPPNFGLLGEVTSMLLTPTHNIDNTTTTSLKDYSAAENHGRSNGNCAELYSSCPLHLTELMASALSVMHGDVSRTNWLY